MIDVQGPYLVAAKRPWRVGSGLVIHQTVVVGMIFKQSVVGGGYPKHAFRVFQNTGNANVAFCIEKLFVLCG